MSILSAPCFHNGEAAHTFVEARIWPNGPVCAHCGCYERIGKMGGMSTRVGTYGWAVSAKQQIGPELRRKKRSPSATARFAAYLSAVGFAMV